MSRIVCITGMDGTGKSTIVEMLSASFPDAHVSNIWDILSADKKIVLFHSKHDIDTYLCSLTPDSRLLFLAHALQFSIDKALAGKKKLIFLNAYYYKYFATELALGASDVLIRSLIRTFPAPDLVVELDLKIDAAAERKSRLSRYECGLAEVPDKDGFITFQNKAAGFWDVFDKTGWEKINADDPKETVFNNILAKIR